MADLIDRQIAISALDEIVHALWEIDIPSPTVPEYIEHHEQVQYVKSLVYRKQKELSDLPSVHPEKDVLTWLMAYHEKASELKARYSPFEVIGWLENDFRRSFMDRRLEE